MLVLLLGFGALLVAPFVLPHGRSRVVRDPHLAAMMYLLEVSPGMPRSVLESHLHRFTKRPGKAQARLIAVEDVRR